MKGIKKELIFIILGVITPLSLHTLKVNAGSFGAEIFCTMRDGGNDHESSWDAAYTYIKKQKGGLFKVSPKNAAAQITETVIREKEKFSYCVEYLDKLHPNRKLIRDLEKEEERTNVISIGNFHSSNPYYVKSKCKFVWSRDFLYYERCR